MVVRACWLLITVGRPASIISLHINDIQDILVTVASTLCYRLPMNQHPFGWNGNS